MKTKLLDYHKLVLRKVSFEPKLFFKEYKKAIKVLRANEVGDLDHWLKEHGLYVILSRSTEKAFI